MSELRLGNPAHREILHRYYRRGVELAEGGVPLKLEDGSSEPTLFDSTLHVFPGLDMREEGRSIPVRVTMSRNPLNESTTLSVHGAGIDVVMQAVDGNVIYSAGVTYGEWNRLRTLRPDVRATNALTQQNGIDKVRQSEGK